MSKLSKPSAIGENLTQSAVLYNDIKQLIEQAKNTAITQVNQTLLISYWHIGKLIKENIIIHDRANYGDAQMANLAKQLVADYGRGLGQRNLFRMAKFYQSIQDFDILTTLSSKLSWSHFVEIIKIDKEIIQAKLHQAMIQAKARLACLPDNKEEI